MNNSRQYANKNSLWWFGGEGIQQWRDAGVNPPEIQSTSMLAFAAVGLVANLISIRILTGGKDKSLNVKGAYLEVWSDLLGSVGVTGGALIIRYTGWAWVDSVVTVGIGLWVLPRTWTLLKSSVNILLERVPEEINIEHLQEALQGVPGVTGIHDLHVWAVTTGKVSLTVRVVHAAEVQSAAILQQIKALLAQQFEITHMTIQCEPEPCDQANEEFHFAEGKIEHSEEEGPEHAHGHS